MALFGEDVGTKKSGRAEALPAEKVEFYQFTCSPNSIWRESNAVLLTRPNVAGVFRASVGSDGCMWLKMLVNCVLNFTPMRSVTRMSLMTEPSRFQRGKPRIRPKPPPFV